MGDVADFMSDDSQQFLVGHDVHQGREYTYTAVRAGEGVHVGDVVDLEVQRDPFYIRQSLRESVQSLGIRTSGIAYLVVLVHPGDVFLYVIGHVCIGQSSGLYRFRSPGGGFADVELCLCRCRSKQEECSDKCAEE